MLFQELQMHILDCPMLEMRGREAYTKGLFKCPRIPHNDVAQNAAAFSGPALMNCYVPGMARLLNGDV
jgi:hypothetical protein